MEYDFSGYATKNDLKCADGRVIRSGAFKDCDGAVVPLVWQHQHNDIMNTLGHALLENRDDGVYAYCVTNASPEGQRAKMLVQNGDITAFSIYANQLKQNGSDVVHGVIREVSLVMAGANPGALIDNLQLSHSDGWSEPIEEEAIIYTGSPLSFESGMMHADEENQNEPEKKEEEEMPKEKTIGEILDAIPADKLEVVYSIIGAVAGEGEPAPNAQEVLDSLTDEQKQAVYAIAGMIVQDMEVEEAEDEADEAVEHSAFNEGDFMKFNVFETDTAESKTLSHDAMQEIFAEAKSSGNGSLKEAVLAHGITDIDVLYPEAQMLSSEPSLISRPMEWVSIVHDSVRKSPFSRVKSKTFNITADDARARGYIKGTQKTEEQIQALKRKTEPTTVYKLQKLDRDDVIDITDFDVVVWMKQEMRTMLLEETARAILIGDGRSAVSQDKIPENNIRPVWTDNDVYTTHVTVDDSLTGSARAKAFIEAAIRARKFYKGSGMPTLFVGQDLLTEMRLIRDNDGYRLYKNDQELADELRVSRIVEIELFDGQQRTVNNVVHKLGGIIVNLADYNVGADRGGEVTLFDDFDLNYNKYEYLIETRMSGALVQPYAAIAIEFAANGTSTIYTQVHPAANADPETLGYYELTGDGYVLSEDNTVVPGKSYYTLS